MVSLFISSDGSYAIKVSVTAVCRLLVYLKISELCYDLYETIGTLVTIPLINRIM